ncbi:MAG: hypothetical protein ACUVSA_12360, partial [Desulfosoma sp.]|uniref:hypothetical protein n=1 Tax=Desulfosoma sp. TaxID=2603217 RepID=UPI00404A01C9
TTTIGPTDYAKDKCDSRRDALLWHRCGRMFGTPEKPVALGQHSQGLASNQSRNLVLGQENMHRKWLTGPMYLSMQARHPIALENTACLTVGDDKDLNLPLRNPATVLSGRFWQNTPLREAVLGNTSTHTASVERHERDMYCPSEKGSV